VTSPTLTQGTAFSGWHFMDDWAVSFATLVRRHPWHNPIYPELLNPLRRTTTRLGAPRADEVLLAIHSVGSKGTEI
jgi:hypothetical protein